MPARVDEDAAWRAVLARSKELDGAVYYGVRTTSVYCRPSCGSRRPRRENVVFFASCDAAESAGFRPCKRCRPTLPDMSAAGLALARAVAGSIDADREGRVTLAKLARSHGVSASRLQRTFVRFAGVSPREYAEAVKMRRVRNTLRSGKTVRDATNASGYGSTSRVYERARSQLGMTPRAFAGGAAHSEIRFAVAGCHLGSILVASTMSGVCMVEIGADAATLERTLRRTFPRAQIVHDAAGLGEAITVLVEHVDGKRPHVDLPRDVQATAFQRLVWAELCKIPRGQTRTYQEIARALGRPRAVRAVARACATNPTALLVPCHRVVRADGDLAGYKWGIHRKRALLDQEARRAEHRGGSP